jgi:hypothetical protein
MVVDMTLDFEPIRLNKQDDYHRYFAACSQQASDYSIVNLWGWAEEYGLYWAWQDDFVWIKQTLPETVYWAPVGKWENAPWDKLLQRYFVESPGFARIPENLHRHWEGILEGRIIAEEDRGHWDYLYHVDELVALQGNRFHKKKNLLNQFLKKYSFQYIPLNEQTIETAKAMQEDWCTWRDCESIASLGAENRVIARILSAWEEFNTVTGAAIMVDNDMAAYTVAEPLPDDTLLIHFEKGNPSYKGVYQAINQKFLAHSGTGHKVVNREQDLGDEGLRKAKLSYHPFDFVKKYKVALR